LMMDGSRAVQAEKVEEFVEQLRRYTRLPVHLQDERLSASEVDRLLIAAGRRRDERKKVVDSGAASVILQGFMDRRKRGRREATPADQTFSPLLHRLLPLGYIPCGNDWMVDRPPA
jgi:RNAse H-fold protein YqgF